MANSGYISPADVMALTKPTEGTNFAIICIESAIDKLFSFCSNVSFVLCQQMCLVLNSYNSQSVTIKQRRSSSRLVKIVLPLKTLQQISPRLVRTCTAKLSILSVKMYFDSLSFKHRKYLVGFRAYLHWCYVCTYFAV